MYIYDCIFIGKIVFIMRLLKAKIKLWNIVTDENCITCTLEKFNDEKLFTCYIFASTPFRNSDTKILPKYIIMCCVIIC